MADVGIKLKRLRNEKVQTRQSDDPQRGLHGRCEMNLYKLNAFDRFTLSGDDEVYIALMGSKKEGQRLCLGEDGYIKYFDENCYTGVVSSEIHSMKREILRLTNLLNEAVETIIMDNY